jgi:deoxyribonuclease-1
VLYQVDGGPTLQAAMGAGAPPVWSGSIPAQPDGATVSYHVEATDNEAHVAQAAGPGYTVDDTPAQPQVEPPVFEQSLLDLGVVSTTAAGSATAHLHNPGEVDVVVESLATVGVPFTCSPSSVVIPAGQTVAVTVQIQPPHNLRYTGWLVASGAWGAVALPLEADGDYPGSTWDSTFNLSGETLKNQLHSLVSGHTSISYDAARLAMFSDIDNVNGWVECVYTGLDVQTTGIPDNAVMNTEHTWPQSYGAEGVARSDLNHLFPTDSGVNSSRGNLPFGDVVVSSDGYPIGGADRGTNAAGVTVFEPRDVHKGDCARAVMYFALRYGNLLGFLDLAGQESVLRTWHQNDPVSSKETNRNNDIAALQVKRNPFIDQPGLLLRMATLDGGNANLPAAPAQAALFPDQLELACAGQPTTALLWLGNPGGTALTLSGISSTDPSCVQPGGLPASLPAGSALAVPVTISGPCDGESTLTVVTGLGSFQIPLTWSWATAQPLDPPAVQLSWQSGGLLLDWEPVAGATAYRVEQASGLGAPWSALSTVTDSQLPLAPAAPAATLLRVVALP